jgi:hypothetical protein
MYDPMDSFVKDMKGNIGFIDRIFSKTTLFFGTVGVIGIFTVIVLFLK